jgi:prevent-host-death family protein
MEKVVSAAEANRHFSELLRSVRDGDSYIVTAHGKPVAKITPVRGKDAVRDKARELLLARLRSQPASNGGRWTREELYEDET